jgi:3-phenylpropionate/cinnamic acid dioxygenase small subunit
MGSAAEVEAVLYRYAHAYDAGDIDAAVACFLPDGVMRVSARSEPVSGREQLTVFFAAARQARRAAGTQPRHLISNVLVSFDKDGSTARSWAYMSLLLSGVTGSAVACTGVYEDRLHRTSDGWQFAERFLRFDTSESGADTLVAR